MENGEPKEYIVSASYVGPDSFMEGFDSADGYNYVPKGWVIGDSWSIGWNNVSDDDKYNLQHSSAQDEDASLPSLPNCISTQAMPLFSRLPSAITQAVYGFITLPTA